MPATALIQPTLAPSRTRPMAEAQHCDFLQSALARPSGRRDWLAYKLTQERLDLSGADFAGWAMRDYDLSDLNLARAVFLEADLAGADFSDAYLCYADLRRARLRAACLDRADLRLAILNSADLTDAVLTDAYLKGAHLAEANLTGADLTDADLTGADLRGASLRFARLRGATLKGANLADADLTGAVVEDEARAQARNWRRTLVRERRFAALERGAYRRLRTEQIGRELLIVGRGPDGADASDGGFDAPHWDAEPDLDTTAGCCLVLEVPPTASLDQIVRAFRKKAKLYHPDMVRHLTPRLQEVAAQEFQRLHRAYERLTRPTTRALDAAAIVWPVGLAPNRSPYAYAIADYERLAQANPSNANVNYNLGWKYFEAGRHVEAMAAFQRVHDLAPGDEDARYNLAICRVCIELIAAMQER